MKKILLVCAGNTCRSPMAVHLFRDYFSGTDREHRYNFQSAGLTAIPGQKMNSKARSVLADKGIEVDGHRSNRLSPEQIKSSDLILTMTRVQAEEILRSQPGAEDYVFTLGEFAGIDREVPDPFGSSRDFYQKTRRELEKMIVRAAERLPEFFARAKSGESEGSDIMKVALGSDHAGYSLKQAIKEWLKERDYVVVDYGTDDIESVDYPDYASAVAQAVAGKEAELGILICGTGLGMSMTANKTAGIRAARCQDTYSARMARRHNDANILTLGERVVGEGLALAVVEAFLTAEFSGGRHERRVNKIEKN